jgi:hypothetical protein
MSRNHAFEVSQAHWLQVASALVRLATQALSFPHFCVALEAALADIEPSN